MNLKKVKLFICFRNAPTDTSTEENAPETESYEEIIPYCNLEDPS